MCVEKGWPLVWAHNSPVAELCTSIDGGPHASQYEGCTDGCWSVNGQCQFDPTTCGLHHGQPVTNNSCAGGGDCNSGRDSKFTSNPSQYTVSS